MTPNPIDLGTDDPVLNELCERVTGGTATRTDVAMLGGVGLFGTFTSVVASSYLAPSEEEQEDELKDIRERRVSIERRLERLSANKGTLSTDAHEDSQRSERPP